MGKKHVCPVCLKFSRPAERRGCAAYLYSLRHAAVVKMSKGFLESAMKAFFLTFGILPLALAGAESETLVIRVGGDKSAMPINDNYKIKNATFQTPEDLFAQIPASDFQKALFYLGFNPEFFNPVNDSRIESDYRENFNEVPFDEDLIKPAKIRDAQKAFEFAKREYARGKKRRCAMSAPLLAVMHLQGIGTPKNVAKALEILQENRFLEPAKNYSEARSRFPQLIAYLYYKGIGVDKDEKKARELVKKYPEAHKNAWRNFYCGYIAPKDFEFAVFVLKNIDKTWAAQTLSDIYNGKYSPSDVNPEQSKLWRERAKILSLEKNVRTQ